MLNSLTGINLTKLDVLTGLPTLKIATAYKIDGEITDKFPASLDELAKAEPQYIELPGWTENITNIKNYEDLPENARKYVEKIEKLTDCKVMSIGVGPARDEMIFKN